MEHSEKTKVIFRKWQGSKYGTDVIALFPEHPELELHQCGSFEHLGQHGAADPNLVIDLTRPATEEEYRELKEELESAPYGYDLDVRKRYSVNMRSARLENWQAFRT